MKKQYFILAALFGAVVSTTACKKCQTCEYQGTESEICRDDYGTQQLYGAYIISLENNGYDCN